MTNYLNYLNRFYSVDEINPKLNLLYEKYDEIQKEFSENVDKLVWINWGASTGYSGHNTTAYDGWKVAALYTEIKDTADLSMSLAIKNLHMFESRYGQKLYPDFEKKIIMCHNAKYLPTLVDTFYKCGITKRIGISVVYPGKDIKWHTDPDPEIGNNAIIRGLWGLDVKEKENKNSYICLGEENDYQKRYFKNNEFIFFWGRINHKVENTLDSPRYVVCFDQDIDKEYLYNIK